jgi:hypothetical protein
MTPKLNQMPLRTLRLGMDFGPMILDTIERSGGVVVWESCFME